eukprot:Amastigsp_a185961_2.p3 type:complete len:108 gc:universal Amastigsp_a185961_2:153-476(+)
MNTSPRSPWRSPRRGTNCPPSRRSSASRHALIWCVQTAALEPSAANRSPAASPSPSNQWLAPRSGSPGEGPARTKSPPRSAAGTFAASSSTTECVSLSIGRKFPRVA